MNLFDHAEAQRRKEVGKALAADRPDILRPWVARLEQAAPGQWVWDCANKVPAWGEQA